MVRILHTKSNQYDLKIEKRKNDAFPVRLMKKNAGKFDVKHISRSNASYE